MHQSEEVQPSSYALRALWQPSHGSSRAPESCQLHTRSKLGHSRTSASLVNTRRKGVVRGWEERAKTQVLTEWGITCQTVGTRKETNHAVSQNTEDAIAVTHGRMDLQFRTFVCAAVRPGVSTEGRLSSQLQASRKSAKDVETKERDFGTPFTAAVAAR